MEEKDATNGADDDDDDGGDNDDDDETGRWWWCHRWLQSHDVAVDDGGGDDADHDYEIDDNCYTDNNNHEGRGLRPAQISWWDIITLLFDVRWLKRY